jgi:uncharacterized SAM-binding protein YcdF (DUF218 family)
MTLRPSLRRAALVLLVFGVVLVLLAFFHRPILAAAASAWIVDSPGFERVDLVLIPGGSFDTRPFGAGELFHEGRAERLGVFKTEKMPTVEMGLRPDDHEICLAVLDRLKVPRDAVLTLGDGVTSTWDEVAVTRAWCLEHQPRSIAIVTELFPSRRVRYAYEKGLGDLPVEIHVVALPAIGYTAADWWRHEKGLIDFQNEVVKWVYYRVR